MHSPLSSRYSRSTGVASKEQGKGGSTQSGKDAINMSLEYGIC